MFRAQGITQQSKLWYPSKVKKQYANANSYKALPRGLDFLLTIL